jgi:hypothetical protein
MAKHRECPVHCTVLAALLKFNAFIREALLFLRYLGDFDAFIFLLEPKEGGRGKLIG